MNAFAGQKGSSRNALDASLTSGERACARGRSRFCVKIRSAIGAMSALMLLSGFMTPLAYAGELAWLDDVVQQVIQESRVAARTADPTLATASARASGRLFARESEQSLEVLARRHETWGRAGRKIDDPANALWDARFQRLVKSDPKLSATFVKFAPAEKRLVVEMGETVQRLSRRFPDKAEDMVRGLGTDGLSAVRVYGDDIAEVMVKEGPETVNILRKTGREGWSFFTRSVLPHKTKLAAAGVLAAFLANPEAFIDSAGRITEYAVQEFAKAGIDLVGAVGESAARGLSKTFAEKLEHFGLMASLSRYLGMGLACLVIVMAVMVLLGQPLARMLWPFRAFFGFLSAVFLRKPKPAAGSGDHTTR